MPGGGVTRLVTSVTPLTRRSSSTYLASASCRSVEIPSDVLLPNVAPRFRDLFSAAPATDRTAGAPTEETTP